jgi:putative flippase GtrA
MADDRRGWRTDPLGIHELRYFSLDGKPTRLVSDDGKTSHDPPLPSAPEGPAHPPTTPHPVPNPYRGRHDANSIDQDRRAAAAVPIRPGGDGGAESYAQPAPGVVATAFRSRSAEPEKASGMPKTPFLQRASLRRLIRYGSVSTISTLTSLILLGLFVGVLDLPAIWANVLAIAIGTIPSFELNRRWVWAQDGQRSILRQVVPYAAFSFAGLIISTFAVHLAADATTSSTRIVHTAAVELASIASYGTLWIMQFVLCDRILFRATPSAADPQRGAAPLLHRAELRRHRDPAGLMVPQEQVDDARAGALQLVDARGTA